MSPATTTLLYSVFALGGVGVYLMLPKSGRSKPIAGGIIGTAAIAALIALLASHASGGDPTTVYFYLFATIAVLAAARVITHPRPVYSAIYFVLVVVAVAALMILLQAEFVAVALIIIYAGAIIVTYLFVIMLAQQEQAPTYDRWSREPFLAVLAGFVLMACVAGRAGDLPRPADRAAITVKSIGDPNPSAPAVEGNTSAIGAAVMGKYVTVLELAGVLLLIAMIGAIALSTKRLPADAALETGRPLGRIGKEVPPF